MKFEFPKLEFLVRSKSLYILKIVIDCKIFLKIVLFGTRSKSHSLYTGQVINNPNL